MSEVGKLAYRKLMILFLLFDIAVSVYWKLESCVRGGTLFTVKSFLS